MEVALPQSGSSSTWFLVKLELEMLVFEERGKPEYAENNLSKQGENQQQSQPTYGVEAGIWTQATLVGGERSHFCAIAYSPKAVINV